MRIIFLTLSRNISLKIRGIYSDLLLYFKDRGHQVYVIYPRERYTSLNTELNNEDDVSYLGVRTLNLQKTNFIEKGIGTILLDYQFRSAIKTYWRDITFDLILFSTPPITFAKSIKALKINNPQARTYLLLKDIFPQNAMDLGILRQVNPLYVYFRNKEKRLYKLSDYIGCMSPANVNYVLAHNPEVDASRVEVAPNSVELVNTDDTDKSAIRAKFGLPVNKPIFIYGGNLGKPQGIPFLIECLEANADREDCFLLVIGTGTELPKLKDWYADRQPKSVKVMDGLPKVEYDELVRSCDVGLIFLDHRFTIPNYPSRLLSYLENKMPVLCATDPNTDMGRIAEENGYGFWCESNSVEAFTRTLDMMIHSDRKAMGEKGYQFLCENYLVQHTYDAIMRHFKDTKFLKDL